MSKVSDCCGAAIKEMIKPSEIVWKTYCTTCFKPCGVKSEPDEVTRTSEDCMVKAEQIQFGHTHEPTPTPESRLLSDTEIRKLERKSFEEKGEHWSSMDTSRKVRDAQDAKTSALVRAECQEDIIPNQDVVLMLQAKDFEIAELRATHNAQLEILIEKGCLCNYYGECDNDPQKADYCPCLTMKEVEKTEALKPSVIQPE